jgi:hypothetical protein
MQVKHEMREREAREEIDRLNEYTKIVEAAREEA